MKTIYVGCPASAYTGGPTLAHQLCYKLNSKGYNAKMYYYYMRKGTDPVHERYKVYNNEYVTRIPDSTDAIVIAPETNTNMLKHLKKSKKVIWWMSVDNYTEKFLKSRRNRILNLMGLLKLNIKRSDIIHFVQSEYARLFLLKQNISKNNIYYLSDYIDDIYINNVSIEKDISKEDFVFYNPKKGYEFTKKIIDKAPHINWIPLENLTPEEMINLLMRGKVYIDFGNHPGKDRIPREAALCGCCIITGRKGSANNNYDVRIPDKYKIEDTEENIPIIIEKITDIINNYEYNRSYFNEYIDIIKNEEIRFDQDIDNIFNKL